MEFINTNFKDNYLKKFSIYCLIYLIKKEQASLSYDLEKELGYKDPFFEKKFQYLYEDTQKFFFMDQQTFEQIELGSDLIPKDQSKFLVENDNVLLQSTESVYIKIDADDGAIDNQFGIYRNDEDLIDTNALYLVKEDGTSTTKGQANFLAGTYTSGTVLLSGSLNRLEVIPDLVSRLKKMEILRLEAINDDELLEATQAISKNLNIKISDKNLNYLINNSRRDIKTIFRTLSQLEKESLERKKSIGLNLIKEVIRSS